MLEKVVYNRGDIEYENLINISIGVCTIDIIMPNGMYKKNTNEYRKIQNSTDGGMYAILEKLLDEKYRNVLK